MRFAIAGLTIAASALATAAMLPASAQTAPRAPAAFTKCAGCHATVAGRPSPVGPNLFGVAGRVAGTAPRAVFSPAMRRAGFVWNAASLDAYIADPKKRVPGTTMFNPPEPNPATRKAIVDYLLTLK